MTEAIQVVKKKYRQKSRKAADVQPMRVDEKQDEEVKQEEHEKHDEHGEQEAQNEQEGYQDAERVEDNCYICLSPVAEVDLFHPCNCDFAPAHRECIERWIAEGKSQCRVCNHYYDASRQNKICFICNLECETRFYPCNCRHIVVHQNCLSQQYNDGHNECPYCRAAYVVNVISTRTTFTTRRCIYPVYAALFLLYVTLFVFLSAPFDILVGIVPTPAQRFSLSSAYGSYLLFPGVALSVLGLLDTLYLSFVGGLIICAVLWLVICGRCWLRERLSALSLCRKLLLPLALIPIQLALHLFGNIHYAFYCKIGVIPDANCFFHFDSASFLASIAGIMLPAVPTVGVIGLVALFKWLFLKKKQIVVVQPTSLSGLI